MAAPRLTEFMLRGYDLADALDITRQWDSLTDADRVKLGFSPDAAPRQAPSGPGATVHYLRPIPSP
jgi:hypothetical protein